MNDEPIEYMALRVESMLPRIARRLFTLDVNHPSGELPSAQIKVCSFLLTFGESSISDVADELGGSVSAATQIADRLEKTGFVERLQDAGDRRVKLLKLTAGGVEMMETRRARRVRRATEALAHMTVSDRSDLIDSLAKLLDASISLKAIPDEGDDAAPIVEVKSYAV